MFFGLLCINFQNDHLEEGGNAPVSGSAALTEVLANFVRTEGHNYRRKYMVGTYRPRLEELFGTGRTYVPICVRDDFGSQFPVPLQALIDDGAMSGIFRMGQYLEPRSAFDAMTETYNYLLDARCKYFTLTNLDICGLTPAIVMQTAIDARALGYHVRILGDLVGITSQEEMHNLIVQCERYNITYVATTQAWAKANAAT